MAKNLVIVESPTKAKTISKFLGSRYIVKASLGHIRDLPKSQLGVDVDSSFKPKYLVPKEKREIVKELKAAAKDATSVFLATDPDREGEAISWHLLEAAGVEPARAKRVVFHEITKEAIEAAFRSPRAIDMQLVNAQQARRILDRLVGYKLSPILWQKVRRGLSAGRVQSVAVKMVVDREREVQGFVPVEYWSVEVELAKHLAGKKKAKRETFRASLVSLWEAREKLEIANGHAAEGLEADLKKAGYAVADVRKKEVQRQPAAPFTTSTLQQEAARKLRFTTKRTMMVAQQLYEGISVGKQGSVGLITYMRTDSTQVAASAQTEARSYIAERYGPEYVPPTPRVFTRKARGAQEAHEAIRPTSVNREPEAIKGHLTLEQYKLYDLIWKRMVSSQMAAAVMDTTSVDVKASATPSGQAYLFRASGSMVKFPGFLSVYSEGLDDGDASNDAKKPLPDLVAGEGLDLMKLLPEQHFTQPPPRYTEASLVRAMEEQGIGRPSTYAPTLSTIQERGYVQKSDRRFVPTELGTVVNDLLVDNFGNIVDVNFTAHMEEELDDVAQGDRDWVAVVSEFYGPFALNVDKASEGIEKVKIADEPAGEDCEKCGRPMLIKMGRYGKFVACSGFPECRNAKPHLIKIGVGCPACSGDLVMRKSKRGRVFYGCAAYPTCAFNSWDRPLPKPCPECGGLLVLKGQKGVKCTICAFSDALEEGYKESAELEAKV
ncbi:MAG: type I DNA topoisomerase [Dehalococcoidia bacterium]|nr:type I DNA topoisomerase [Dehalococcoidia bacterium]